MDIKRATRKQCVILIREVEVSLIEERVCERRFERNERKGV